MAKVLDQTPFPYVPKDDRDLSEGERTTFLVRALSYSERMWAGQFRMRQESDDRIDVVTQPGEKELRIVRAGLVGWKNFRGVGGKEVEFVSAREDGRTLASQGSVDLASIYVEELARVIWAATTLGTDAAKNY